MRSSTVGNALFKPARKSGLRRSDNIRKRGGKFQVRLVVNGESLCKTFDIKQEALRYLDLKRGETFDGDPGEFHKAQQLTLRTAIIEYRNHLIESDGADAEQQQLSRLKILAELQGMDIEFLGVLPNNIESIFAALQAKGPRGKPLGDNTMRLYYAALSSVYKHYITGKQWYFLSNPLTVITRPAPGAARTRRLADDEEERIVEALAEYGPGYTLTFLLLISTTMRMGELFALTWDQFDEERSRFDIKVSKTGERECPLSSESVELLSRLPRVGEKVLPITRDAFEMAWKRTMPRLNIKNLRRHDLRREGLTRWAQRGIDVVNLMRISGHKTMSQAQKYLVGTTDEAINAMNSRLADDPYLKHRDIKRAEPKASMLRHFHVEQSPTDQSTPAMTPAANAPKSNVVAFSRALPRALAPATRRTSARTMNL